MRMYHLRLVLILAACSLLPAARYAWADDDDHREHGKAHDEMAECAEECSECARECSSCATHCAKMLADGKKKHGKTLATCLDCADICNVAALIVARSGPFNKLICQACADACARCGKACEAFPDDKHMQRCARACRDCEKECREMLKHDGHHKRHEHGDHDHDHDKHESDT